MIKVYIVIDNNVVVNSILIDSATDFNVDAGLLLPVDTTPSIDWQWDTENKKWSLVRQENGGAQIGFAWNGSECVTTFPEPDPIATSQPTTTGSQTL
jgi:hypothetical protein